MESPKTSNLTPKQKEVFRKIKAFNEKHGKTPTISELAEAIEAKSLRSVTQYLQSLEQKGLISRSRYQKRGIKILEDKNSSETVLLPVLSAASCGALTTIAEQIFDEYISVAKSFLKGKKREDSMVIRAIGNSMQDAGIDDGDYVLTEVTKDVADNDKVVAVIDDMAVIKKFQKTNDAVILTPMSSDPKYVPIIMKDNFEIFGKVIDVIKRPKNNELTYVPVE